MFHTPHILENPALITTLIHSFSSYYTHDVHCPLETLAKEGELKAYLFDGYWQCMDTKREMDKLNELWDSGKAPWKTWND